MAETPTERNDRIYREARAAGEPVFVLRAKDRLALDTIDAYGHTALTEGATDDFMDALLDVEREFATWRADNPDAMKLPDVRDGG
jgi:hypothetical protein